MASTTPPRVLKNFNVFVNGKGFAGRVDECTLPEISIKTEEHRAGGMDGSIELDMGMETMSSKFTFSDPDPDLLKLVGLYGNNSTRITVRGSFVRDMDNSRVALVAELGGKFKKLSMGTWKGGDKAPQEYEMSVNYYKLSVGGVDTIEVDIENMVRMIGGVDQLAGIRADIGLN